MFLANIRFVCCYYYLVSVLVNIQRSSHMHQFLAVAIHFFFNVNTSGETDLLSICSRACC